MNLTSRLLLIAFVLGGPLRAGAQQDKLTFYGFFDFQAEATHGREGSPSTFHQHHLNLVTVYEVDDRWRVFTEVEYEHGPALEGSTGNGEILLERAVLEYHLSDVFEVRLGKFLTPFGLYNERHDASPSLLSTSLPTSVYSEARANDVGGTQELFSKFATGVQLRGTLARIGWGVDYALYVSNGRGPAPAQQDNNSNKGIGGRLAVRIPGNDIQLGASFYDDRNGEAANTRQQSFGLDATVRYFGLLVESEALIPRLERVNAAGAPNGTYRTARGYYIQISHPFTDALTPFARFDAFDNNISASRDGETDVVVGLNLAATRSVFFKSEVHFPSYQDPARTRHQQYLGSVAVAF